MERPKRSLPRPRRAWLRYILPLAGLVVVAGGAGLAAFATDTTESFWDGIWWSISLITTVGWSGQAPTTLAGHLIATATMLVGFLLLAFVTATIASLLVREDEAPVEQAELQTDAEILEQLHSLRAEVGALRAEVSAAKGRDVSVRTQGSRSTRRMDATPAPSSSTSPPATNADVAS